MSSQGIALRTRFFLVDWTLNFTHTTVVIDDDAHELAWGQHFFPLEPGRHELQVSYRYLRLSRAGVASMPVDVVANQTLHVSYRAPLSVLVAYQHAKLTIDPRLQP